MCVSPLLSLDFFSLLALPLLPSLYTASLYIYLLGIVQHTGNHGELPNFGKTLAYSWEVEISRRFHKSFAILWKVVEGMALEF